MECVKCGSVYRNHCTFQHLYAKLYYEEQQSEIDTTKYQMPFNENDSCYNCLLVFCGHFLDCMKVTPQFA